MTNAMRIWFALSMLGILGANNDDVFPKSIPLYPHRRDHVTGELVARGRLHLLGGLSPLPEANKVSLEELRRVLQCSPEEPDLVGDRGSVLLATRLAPPTRETVRLMAVWAETLCDRWSKCNDELIRFDKKEGSRDWGNPDLGRRGILNSPFQARLLRVHQGKLYIDWPFHHKERFAKEKDYLELSSTKYDLLHLALGKVKNLNDSVFFFGEEVAYMPFHFPFFAFSSSPSMKHADMPWPWLVHQKTEAALYRKYFVRETDASASSDAAAAAMALINAHSETFNSMNTSVWNRKKSKAAFFGAMSTLRHIFFDIAARHPDLIDAGWTGGINSWPWNPLSRELEIPYDGLKQAIEEAKSTNSSSPSGFLKTLLPSHLFEGHPVDYYQNGHGENKGCSVNKYLVVLVGGSGAASADRLASMMLHSGAVLLIQKHEFEYHFSQRLKPWIHYVPLTYTAADLPDKIRWLQQNDHLARTLAHNARTFALAHLRIEDLVCYAASALALVGSVPAPEPFDPILLPSQRHLWEID